MIDALLVGAQAVTEEVAAAGAFSANAFKFLAVGLAGLSLAGVGIGLGILGASAMNALGRNPEARTAIAPNMVLALAFTEAIGIYALVTAILLIFVA
ncbi:MAG: ATP synthase F0 subunit C [SAR202 cluster bacterium]|nr:ATP synthase F0 subunit C [SAR202 cluster bacterium]